jgi:hypothetical protein
MKRRTFLKHGAIWAPALIGLTAKGAIVIAGSPRSSTSIAGGGSCPADGSPSSESDQATAALACGRAAANHFAGHAAWNDGGVSRTICKLGFEVGAIDGTVTGKTYTAYIYTMTGFDLNAVQATSTGIAGPAATGWIYFSFPTPFATGGASTPYAFVVTPGSVDSTNDIWFNANDTNNITGYRESFTSGGAFDNGSGNDCSIRIYWQ